MARMRELKDSEYSPLMRVLFGLDSPSPLPQSLNDPELGLDNVAWVDLSLNESQKEAVKFAIACKEVALIHGPPGTGKTHTLIELILQLLRRNLRLLVCGPSNISVDNIVERLAPHRVPIVRLGHPARLLPSVLNHSLDVLTRTSEAAEIVHDIRKEIDAKEASIRKTRSGRERRAIYIELRDLRKEYRARERKCVDNLVRGSKVVLATLHGAGGWNIKNEQYDVVIIDEASQALEAQCWIPLLAARKVVLAGDHMQLPPTVKSVNSKSQAKGSAEANSKSTAGTGAKADALSGISLESALFDRLLKLHGREIKRMLTTQYRMHEKIMAFPSEELYEGRLEASETVRTRLLKDLPYAVADTEDSREPLVFWDTQGGDYPEKTEDEGVGGGSSSSKARMLLGESRSNEGEAQVVQLHVAALVDGAGVKAEDIAVITPYNAQLALLSQMLKERYPGLELGSVDGFQGREKEAVIVSLVRSGADVGFLADKRRLNGKSSEGRQLDSHLGRVGRVGRPVLRSLWLIVVCSVYDSTAKTPLCRWRLSNAVQVSLLHDLKPSASAVGSRADVERRD